MLRILGLPCATLLLFAGAAIADCKVQKVADLPVTMAGYPLVEAKVNGTSLRFVADSGAFYSLISPAVAAQLHLGAGEAPFGMTVEGLGGQGNAQVGRAKNFEIAGAALHNIDFLVAGNGLGPGVAGLIGQNILGFADVEYDLADGMIRLWKPVGCGDRVMAYWLKSDQAFGQLNIEPLREVRHTIGDATINGHKLRAEFDTGSGASYVLKGAARRAGIDVTGSDMAPAGRMTGGVGLKTFPTFIAPVESFGVGGEEIHSTHLRVGDANLSDADMLIGADFFLSHRIYVSNAQQRMYFTYNGGPVFDISAAPHAAGPPASSTAAKPAIPAAGPAPGETADNDAGALARHGDASAARDDYPGAITDLTRARAAAPNNPDYAYDRARAYLGNRKPDEALGDLNDAVRLAPDDVSALILRAQIYLARSDEARAIIDLDGAAGASTKQAEERLALAQLYLRADAPVSAISQFDLWLTAHPQDVARTTAFNGRCWARAILGQELAKALADCDAAVRGGNKVAQALDNRGLVHLRLGQFNKAIADYDAGLAISPKIPWALYGRGIAQLRLGKTIEGKADIATAIALAPKLPLMAKRYGVTP